MPEPILLQTKEDIYNQMLSFLEKSKKEGDSITFGYDDVLDTLKRLDKKLEDKCYTDVHPSRYELVKLIEKAEGWND